MEEKKYELIRFNDGEFSLDINVNPSEEIVWLNRKQKKSLLRDSNLFRIIQ